MVMCFVPDCKHYNEKHNCSFYKFPKTAPNEYKRWIKLIRRGDRQPSKHSVVCSCHFKDGKKENGPTLYKRNESSLFQFNSPEKKSRKTKTNEEIENTASINNTVEESITPSTNTSTEVCTSAFSVAATNAENYFLKQNETKLLNELNYMKNTFNFKTIENKTEYIILYTGLPNATTFMSLLNLCNKFNFNYYYGWNVTCIKPEDQLLMTLMKLRRNDPHLDLALRFNCSRKTVVNVILTWIHALHEILVKVGMKTIPSVVKNQACLPSCFSYFTQCRMILDCTEVHSEVPKNMEKKRLMYSHYKHNYTMKGLVCVAPNGVVTFLNDLYPGCTSDKEIVSHCGIVNQMKPGDLLLADKGFLISDVVPQGVSVNIPPFLTTPQFTPEQILDTCKIARARIHVERAIKRIKGYTILDFIPHTLFPHASKVWQVCGALTNLQNPLIKEIAPFARPQSLDSVPIENE